MIVYVETEGYVVQGFDTETQEFISSEFFAANNCEYYLGEPEPPHPQPPGIIKRGVQITSYDVPEELVEMVQKHYYGYDMVQPSPPKRKKKAKATRKKKTKRKKSKS